MTRALRAAWWIATHPIQAVIVFIFAIALYPVVAPAIERQERKRRIRVVGSEW